MPVRYRGVQSSRSSPRYSPLNASSDKLLSSLSLFHRFAQAKLWKILRFGFILGKLDVVGDIYVAKDAYSLADTWS